MTFLQILALTLQLADGINTCRVLRNPDFQEANPLLGRNPSCARVLGTKGAFLVPMFVLPKGKYRTGFTVGNIAAGGIGFSVSIWNEAKH